VTDAPHTANNKDADNKDTVWIVYDGACPLCSAYVRMVRLKQALGDVRLVDAREGGPVVEEVMAQGFDLDQGMAMKMGGRFYHGGQVMHMIAMMSSEAGLFNRLHAWAFRSPLRAKVLYPPLRTGRNIALRLLGHKPLAEAGLGDRPK